MNMRNLFADSRGKPIWDRLIRHSSSLAGNRCAPEWFAFIGSWFAQAVLGLEACNKTLYSFFFNLNGAYKIINKYFNIKILENN